MAQTSTSTAGNRSTTRMPRAASTAPALRGKAAAKGPDAIALLKEDHQKVRDLLEKLTNTSDRSGPRRLALLDKIETEITVHATIEEEIFYPAFREAAVDRDGEQMFHEAQEEHHIVKVVMPEVRDADPSTPVFAARAKVLKDLIEHHADEEEKEMFKEARKNLGKVRLQELGTEMAARKKVLLSGMRRG